MHKDGEPDAREKLTAAIKQLMNTRPLEQITVTQVVLAAGVTRQTFYRYYRDKYDLVNGCFDDLAEKCFDKMGVSRTLRESLVLKFDFIREDKEFFMQAFKSTDCNSIVRHDYEYILKFYTNLIRNKIHASLDEGLSFLLRMYCHGSIMMTAEWAVNGMKEPSASLADNLLDAMPPKLADVLRGVL